MKRFGLIFLAAILGLLSVESQSLSVLTAPGAAVIASKKVASGGGGGGGDTAWLTLTAAGSSRNNFPGVVGCKFTVNSSITITKFYGYTFSGSTQSHRIGLWDSSFNKLGEITLNKTGLGTGFQGVALGTPITLSSGSYYFGEEEFSSGDSFYNDNSTVTTTGVATITTSSFHSDSYDAPASGGTAGVACFGPVNFDYH